MTKTIGTNNLFQISPLRSKRLSSILGMSLALLLLAPRAEANWRIEGFTIRDITTGKDGRISFTLAGDRSDFCSLGRDDLRGAYTIPGDGTNKPNAAMYALLIAAYLSGKAVGAQNIGSLTGTPDCDLSFRYHLPMPDEVWVMP